MLEKAMKSHQYKAKLSYFSVFAVASLQCAIFISNLQRYKIFSMINLLNSSIWLCYIVRQAVYVIVDRQTTTTKHILKPFLKSSANSILARAFRFFFNGKHNIFFLSSCWAWASLKFRLRASHLSHLESHSIYFSAPTLFVLVNMHLQVAI